MRPRKSERFASGCGYLAMVLIAACVMLLVNGMLVQAALIGYRPIAPPEINDERAQQAIRFIAPLAMLFMEYWLYDWMVDRLSSEAISNAPHSPGSHSPASRPDQP